MRSRLLPPDMTLKKSTLEARSITSFQTSAGRTNSASEFAMVSSRAGNNNPAEGCQCPQRHRDGESQNWWNLMPSP